MELFDLEFGLKNIASAGNVLNCQELTGIQAGLTLLRNSEKVDSIYFWGKIFGQQADYYLAYALKPSEFEFPSKQFFCAGEDFQFKALNPLTEEVADRIIDLGINKPLTGVPTTPLEPPPAEGEAPEGEEGAEVTEQKYVLTEADRLVQVIQEIDFDTAVAPKGAYSLNEAHVVVSSGDFKGLGITEATQLSSYIHFRPPTSVAALRALARTDVQFYGNFLDPLEGDLPKGCWAVRQDPSVSLITLRSLSWPGYISFHCAGTTKFGGLYFGYGQKNRDLPFIL
jgi:radial spoke head protein 9